MTDLIAITSAAGLAAATAAGIVAMARGSTRGAPGISRSLSRLGDAAGGGMLTGVAVAAGTGALAGLGLYNAVCAIDAGRIS